MTMEGKLRLVDVAIKLLIVVMVLFWIGVIYYFATSTLPMLRQLLGCMLSTMAIFSVMSFTVARLKNYQQSLKEQITK